VIPWLAEVLADELGDDMVVEHAGWQTHRRPGSWSPVCGIVHATAAPSSQLDSIQIGIVRNGRSDLIGPIANACVDRRGRWHVLSAGRCNTTLAGTAGPFKGVGNTGSLGVEACHNNIPGTPWPAIQYESYAHGWAAICRRLGWSAAKLVGHKEHTPGHKSDPTFNMANFRTRVTYYLNGGEDDMALSADDRLLLEQTRAAVLGLRWLYTANRDQFVKDKGDPRVWDYGGGLGENTFAEKLAELAPMTDAQIRAISDRIDIAVRETLAAAVPAIVAAVRDEVPETLTVEDVAGVVRTLLGDLKLRAEVA
jgi:hypothetical protein